LIHHIAIMSGITKNDLLEKLDPKTTKTYIGSHIQTITLDEILNNLQKNETIDPDELFDMYLDAYPELKKSSLITPNNLMNIHMGDTIRYSKSIDELSCCCIVLRVKIIGQLIESDHPITEKEIDVRNNGTVEYFLVRGFGNEPRIWKIYPENYYFFILPMRIYNKGKLSIKKFTAEDQKYIEDHQITKN